MNYNKLQFNKRYKKNIDIINANNIQIIAAQISDHILYSYFNDKKRKIIVFENLNELYFGKRI